jgi:hypothetical protein
MCVNVRGPSSGTISLGVATTSSGSMARSSAMLGVENMPTCWRRWAAGATSHTRVSPSIRNMPRFLL